MLGPSLIVPEVGPGLWLPRFQLTITSGAYPLPRSSDYTRDIPKGHLVASSFTSGGTPLSSPTCVVKPLGRWALLDGRSEREASEHVRHNEHLTR